MGDEEGLGEASGDFDQPRDRVRLIEHLIGHGNPDGIFLIAHDPTLDPSLFSARGRRVKMGRRAKIEWESELRAHLRAHPELGLDGPSNESPISRWMPESGAAGRN